MRLGILVEGAALQLPLLPAPYQTALLPGERRTLPCDDRLLAMLWEVGEQQEGMHGLGSRCVVGQLLQMEGGSMCTDMPILKIEALRLGPPSAEVVCIGRCNVRPPIRRGERSQRVAAVSVIRDCDTPTRRDMVVASRTKVSELYLSCHSLAQRAQQSPYRSKSLSRVTAMFWQPLCSLLRQRRLNVASALRDVDAAELERCTRGSCNVWANHRDGPEARAAQQLLLGSTGSAEIELHSFAVASVLSAEERLRMLRFRSTHSRLSRIAFVLRGYEQRLQAELSLQQWAAARKGDDEPQPGANSRA